MADIALPGTSGGIRYEYQTRGSGLYARQLPGAPLAPWESLAATEPGPWVRVMSLVDWKRWEAEWTARRASNPRGVVFTAEDLARRAVELDAAALRDAAEQVTRNKRGERMSSNTSAGTLAARTTERDTAEIPAVDRLAWLDTETTGLSPTVNQILELAVLTSDLDGGNPREPWSTLVLLEPWAECTPQAMAVHGIDPHAPEYQRSARALRAVLRDLAARLAGARVAGHNVAFDVRMLIGAYDRAQLACPPALHAPTTDTQTLARELHKRGVLVLPANAKGKPSFALGSLRAALGIVSRSAAHRAAADVGDTLRAFRALRALESKAATNAVVSQPSLGGV